MPLLRNLLFWIVLALVGAGVAAFVLSQDPGHVLVRWRGTDYTTTVLHAAWMVLGVALALWITWTLLAWPFRAWSLHRDRQQRARVGDGFEALHQGHYTRAEKLLLQTSDDEQVEAAARIGAARAALARGDHAAARTHLDGFADRHPASRAIALAELALQEGRPTDALVALDAPAAQPLPPRGLALRAEALAQSGQSTQAYGLVGVLRKQQAWTEAELADREVRWATASLREGDENAFAQQWEAMPKSLRTEPVVVIAHATRAAELGWEEAATRSIERALDARWDERLATLYGRLPVGRLEHRRAQAERWLQAHPGSLALPATLARSRTRSATSRRPTLIGSRHWPKVAAPRTGRPWATPAHRAATNRVRASAMRMPCAHRAANASRRSMHPRSRRKRPSPTTRMHATRTACRGCTTRAAVDSPRRHPACPIVRRCQRPTTSRSSR